jgi:hypothetical protein
MWNEKPSRDIAAFHDLVETSLRPSSVRWETFGTPEYSGGVPGPTDYVILVAEVEPPMDREKFLALPQTGGIWIAPEAARPWLSEEFRAILEKTTNQTLDLSTAFNCRKYQGREKKTSSAVEGFVCNGATRSLVYLTLLDNTKPCVSP